MMRAHIFHTGFWALSGAVAIVCAPVLLIPGRGAVTALIGFYARAFRAWLRVCGVSVEYRGLEHLDAAGPAVIAAKHQSYGDGLCHLARDRELAYVIGDHMLRFPLIGLYLKKAEAVVVDNAGGRRNGGALDEGAERLAAEKRQPLIFPEGGLSPVGAGRRYRRGVHKLAYDLDRPVVPAATNLGCFWPEQEWKLVPGRAVIEFLAPVTPGEDPRAFMTRLETAIESRTRALEADAHAEARKRRAIRIRKALPKARQGRAAL